MKARLATLAMSALLGAAGATNALAHEDYTEGGSLHWLADLVAVKGQQGQPAAMRFAPVGDYGEGTTLINFNRTLSPKGQLAGEQPTHSEYEEGTALMHAGHSR